jgi:hypothetical protein
MFDRIHALSVTVRGFVKKTQYVFAIVTWAMESLGKIADILATFPRPPVVENAESKNTSDERPGEVAKSNGDGTSEQSV